MHHCCRTRSYPQRFQVTEGCGSSPLGIKKVLFDSVSEDACAPELLVQFPALQACASFGLCPSRRALCLRVETIPKKPTNINPLNKPNTRTTGLSGTRIISGQYADWARRPAAL